MWFLYWTVCYTVQSGRQNPLSTCVLVENTCVVSLLFEFISKLLESMVFLVSNYFNFNGVGCGWGGRRIASGAILTIGFVFSILDFS